MNKINLLWFRQDLRTLDNPMFDLAGSNGLDNLAIYIFDEQKSSESIFARPGAAAKVYLHHSLLAFKQELKEQAGLDLIVLTGDSKNILEQLSQQLKAQDIQIENIISNKVYEAYYQKLDTEIETLNLCRKHHSLIANNFMELDEIKNKTDGVFKVFTPFYKSYSALVQNEFLDLEINECKKIKQAKTNIASLEISDLELLPKSLDWHLEIEKIQAGEFGFGSKAALNKAKAFIENDVSNYKKLRDMPAILGTSRLAPALHFGEISPLTIYKLAKSTENSEAYIRQLFWREFAQYILHHMPFTAEKNLRPEFSKMPWIDCSTKENKEILVKWQKGQTGYPIVDAGMRELYATGYMHNRVRMIVGSFLVKDLMIHWLEGAKWFWDTLCDADLANNSMGWQWVAGSGVDASPYFRIFNPWLQSVKFDPDGDYIRRWVPELQKLNSKQIHEPAAVPPLVLQQAGITLGKTYPYPMVNHKEARDKALEAFKALKD